MSGLLVLLVLLVVVGLLLMSIFNKLVALKNRYLNAFSQIQVQLKRRYDLVPALVETAKGYMAHEKETLEAVIDARNQASSTLKNAMPDNAQTMQELSSSNVLLGQEIGKFNLLVEDYPDLKANENMIKLHEELTTTENKVSFARQSYNDSVMEYNTYRQSFPQNMIAVRFGHPRDATLLEFEDEKSLEEMPEIKF